MSFGKSLSPQNRFGKVNIKQLWLIYGFLLGVVSYASGC